MTEISDLNDRLRSLIAGCAISEKESFAELYNLTAAKVLAVQVRILGKNPSAESALHDTYSYVWLKAREYDSASGEPMTWLYGIARNHALNLRRARTDTKASANQHDQTADLSTELADVSYLENHPEAGALLSSLNGLNFETRECIVTAYLDGLSVNDLSRVYNAPEEAVQNAVHQGMLELRGRFNASV